MLDNTHSYIHAKKEKPFLYIKRKKNKKKKTHTPRASHIKGP